MPVGMLRPPSWRRQLLACRPDQALPSIFMSLLLIQPAPTVRFQPRSRMGGCCSLPWPRPGPRPAAASNRDHHGDLEAAPGAAAHTVEACVFCQIAGGLREQHKVVFQVCAGRPAAHGIEERLFGDRDDVAVAAAAALPPILAMPARSVSPSSPPSYHLCGCRASGWWCSTTAAPPPPPTCKSCRSATSTTSTRCGHPHRTTSWVGKMQTPAPLCTPERALVCVNEARCTCAVLVTVPAATGPRLRGPPRSQLASHCW